MSAISPIVDCTAPIATDRLRGKSVFITGGASGLGAGIAKRFAEAGAYVTIADVDSTLGEAVRDELKSLGLHANFVRADVTNWDELVKAFVAAIEFSPHKGLDVVCPNAGIVGPQLISQWPRQPVPTAEASLDTPPPHADLKSIEVNLLAVLHCVHLAYHYFKLPTSTPQSDEQGSKVIILTGSVKSYADCMGAELYGVGKMAVRALFKSIRGAVPGVRVCMVAPTYMDTPLVAPLIPHVIAQGIKLAPVSSAVSAFLRLACDPTINGRSLVVSADGVFDVRDDFEGLDGGVEMRRFAREGNFGPIEAKLAWGEEKPEEDKAGETAG